MLRYNVISGVCWAGLPYEVSDEAMAEIASERLERQQRLVRESARALRAKRSILLSIAQPPEEIRLQKIHNYFSELRQKVRLQDYAQ